MICSLGAANGYELWKKKTNLLCGSANGYDDAQIWSQKKNFQQIRCGQYWLSENKLSMFSKPLKQVHAIA